MYKKSLIFIISMLFFSFNACSSTDPDHNKDLNLFKFNDVSSSSFPLLKKVSSIAKTNWDLKDATTNDVNGIIESGIRDTNAFMTDALASGNYIDMPSKFLNEITILHSRININKNKGNNIAIKRDETRLLFLKTYNDINEFLYRISSSLYGYETKTLGSKDIQYLKKENNNTYEKIKSYKLYSENISSGKIAKSFISNIDDLESISYVYGNVLDWVAQHPDDIKYNDWTDKASMINIINFINDNKISKAINGKLSLFSLDVGGITLFVIIFTMVVMVYPIVFRTSKYYIDKYILKEDALTETIDSSKELVIVELRKPIKILLVFFGLDLSTQALLYKTKLTQFVDDISFVVYVVIFSWILLKIINALVSTQVERMKKSNSEAGMRKELFNLIINIVKAIIIVVSSILILTHFGISIAAILSTLGIGGLAFALAAKDTLSNLFGGVSIMIDNVFHLGDWVKIGTVEGTVAQIGLRSTTIRTFDNALITVPNALISTKDVLNWNRRKVGRRIKMMLSVSYESKRENIQNAVQDIRNMLKNHKGISSSQEKIHGIGRATHFYKEEDIHGIKNTQLVFVDAFNEYSIDILVYCFSKTVNWEDWLIVKEDVLYKISEIFEKNHVEFAYPTEIQIEKKVKFIDV